MIDRAVGGADGGRTGTECAVWLGHRGIPAVHAVTRSTIARLGSERPYTPAGKISGSLAIVLGAAIALMGQGDVVTRRRRLWRVSSSARGRRVWSAISTSVNESAARILQMVRTLRKVVVGGGNSCGV